MIRNNDEQKTELTKLESAEEMIGSNVLPLIWVGKSTNCLRFLAFNIEKNSIVFDEITSLFEC